MNIPTEPIGSIPRPLSLIEAINARGDGTDPSLDGLYEEATRDTIEQFEATGSPVITDGEQRKYHNFWTYSVHGLKNTSPDGFKIPFSAGHTRRMLRLTAEPFRYKRYADQYLDLALRYAHVPLKQAVISPSALSLMYPAEGIPGYSRDQFIEDLLREHETEVRRCLQKGAYKVQIDFTEGRLALKIDPSGNLLSTFIDLNNLALSRFSAADRQRIGVHTCPGGDRDSTHSADVDYAELLPSLFELNVGNLYVALAGETDRPRVLETIRQYLRPDQKIFVGVVAPIDPHIETPEEVRDRVLEAAQYIPVDGGSVETRSDGPGTGSEFIVRLPIRTPLEVSDIEATAENPVPGAGLKILVVDDNRDAADACASLLELSGHLVQTAYTGRHAVELAETFRPHALLLDIGLPDFNGYELAAKIRASPWGRDVMLIAVTGWGQEEDRRRALEAGCDLHLTKPVAPETVESLLQSLEPASRSTR